MIYELLNLIFIFILFLPFLSNYSLLIYRYYFLKITSFHELFDQHIIYLILFFITFLFSQLINNILVTRPVILFCEFFDFDIFLYLLEYPRCFKQFIII